MEALLEAYKYTEDNTEAFEQEISAIVENLEEPYSLLRDIPYTNKKGLAAGYNVTYGYRMAVEKLIDGGQQYNLEVAVFTIFNLQGQNMMDNEAILEEVKDTIAHQIRSTYK